MLHTISPIIGHRGASAYAPENTRIAFQKAWELGCNCIEFDVMLSADGEPFIIHDETLERTTNGRGAVGLVEAAYLKSLDAGGWFSKSYANEEIPHLGELLQWINSMDMQANIEIKPFPGTTEKTVQTVLTYLDRYWSVDKPLPLISSFDFSALMLCRSLNSELPIGMLLDRWDDEWLVKANTLGCKSIHLNRHLLTSIRVQSIKSQGYAVFAYTVNSQRQAKKLLSWGVDAVFSDYPDLLS